LKFTAEDYAKKHNITVSVARDRLNGMYERGAASRMRSGKIGGTYVYELVNDLKAHDPFNFGGKRNGKYRKASASISDTSD
jgi:hypothetical protein